MHWAAIRAVADALLDRGELNQQQVVDLIEQEVSSLWLNLLARAPPTASRALTGTAPGRF